MMPTGQTLIVNTNIFHYFKRKTAMYVINCTKNFKIKMSKAFSKLDGMKHFVTSSVYLYSNNRWLTSNQIASLQRIVVQFKIASRQELGLFID